MYFLKNLFNGEYAINQLILEIKTDKNLSRTTLKLYANHVLSDLRFHRLIKLFFRRFIYLTWGEQKLFFHQFEIF